MLLSPFSSLDREPSRGLPLLLTTKFQVPQLPPHYVPRPHLVEQMRAAVTRRLALVSAPAGFGKTALLAEWCRSTDLAVTWLSLEPADNEPGRFFTYLLAALQRYDPLLASPPSLTVPEHRPTTGEEILTRLINDLASHSERELVIVLDNYHLITNDALHQVMCYLLEHLPDQMHLIIGTRATPPFPLARWRAQGRLAELESSALRFSEAEIAALLCLAGLDGAPDLPYRIARWTEGWITGVQLATLAWKPEPSSVMPLTHCSLPQPQRFISAYLDEEILAQQPPEIRAFLVQTSILERLNGALCDAVTGRQDSQAILERLCQANQFTEALDESGQCYRYHPLLADALRTQLKLSQPELVSELHQRASHWYEQHGLIEQAIEHALSAQDETRAGTLLETATRAFFLQGAYTSLLRWLERMPASQLVTRPHLGILYAWMLVCDERVEQAHAVAQMVEHHLRELEEGRGDSLKAPASQTLCVELASSASYREVRGELALLSATLAWVHGEPAHAKTLVHQVLQTTSRDHPFLHRFATFHLGLIARTQGDLAGAEASLLQAWTPDPTIDLHDGHLTALTELASLYEARGDLWKVARLYRDARRLLARRGQAHSSLMGWILVGKSQLLRERNTLQQAAACAQEAFTQGREENQEELVLTSLLALATIAQAQGRDEEVQRWVHSFDLFLEEQMVPTSILAQLGAKRARLELACGKIEFALEWAEMRGLYPGDGVISMLDETGCCDPVVLMGDVLVLARLLIAQERRSHSGEHIRQALSVLDRVRKLAEQIGLMGRLIETQIVQAMALQVQGKIGEATAVLRQAVELAGPRGYIRLFADEGAPMACLLAKLQGQRQDPSGYLHTLREACATGKSAALLSPPLDATVPCQSGPSMFTPLSPREQEILRLLATGASNQQIAASLVITPETVKRHVRHILAKLSVTNRTQAASRARMLHLL